MGKPIIDQIIEMVAHLPKKQRQLCSYIIDNQSEVGMMTVAELASRANVGTTTVLRLAEMLGYESYTDFRKTLMEEHITKGNSSYNQLISSFNGRHDKSDNTLNSFAAEAGKKLQTMCTPSLQTAFEQATDVLLSAKGIGILGLRSSAALAMYLSTGLSTFMPNVQLFSFEQEYLADRLFAMGEGSVMFIVSVWPCTRRSILAAEICHKKNIPIVLLTNTNINPIAQFADVILDTDSFNQSCTSILMMGILSALVQELGRRTAPYSTEALHDLEKQLAEYNLIQWEQEV